MTTETAAGDRPERWTAWNVAPGFEVADPRGGLGLVQLSGKTFEVTASFRVSDPGALDDLLQKLTRAGVDEAEAGRRIEDARTVLVDDEPRGETTDLASIPPFMRWFENSYGCHTLAAIIHDRLIRDETNTGALHSDTLADRFFRQMLKAAGVPFFKRWILWTAVALRTRWAAGGYRRVTVLLWVVLAALGLLLGANLLVPGVSFLGLGPGVWFGVAAGLPIASAPLWGRQYGASLVAALAVPWILPPALLAAAGWVVYRALEGVFGSSRLLRRRRGRELTPAGAPAAPPGGPTLGVDVPPAT